MVGLAHCQSDGRGGEGGGGSSPRVRREAYSLLSDCVSRQKIQLAPRQRGRRVQTALISRDKLQANQSQFSTSGGKNNNRGLFSLGFFFVGQERKGGRCESVPKEMFRRHDGSARLAVPLIHSSQGRGLQKYEMFTSRTSG